MRVVINGWFAGRADAGHGQYIDHLVRYLAAMPDPAQLTMVIPAPTPPPLFDAPQGAIEIVQLEPPRLPRNLAKVAWEQITMPRAAARLQADVLWIPYWAAPVYSPCPVVVTVHDLIPYLLPGYRGGRLQRLYTRFVAATARRADRIIAVSEAAKRDIAAHLAISPERIHVVHHGPNQEGAPPPSPADLARVRTALALPARFFLYLGGFDRRKNVLGILQAYQRYLAGGGDSAVRLVIAGRLPAPTGDFAPDPRLEAARLGIEEQVHFCGWVDEQDKPALYSLAAGFIFPSLYEGFGMMLLEAMAAGAPVITSDGRGWSADDGG